MTTKTKELTNEMVAKALGWEEVGMPIWWAIKDEQCVLNLIHKGKKLPDFLNDLNATFKYVVPELKQTYYGRFPNRIIGKTIEGALDDDRNTATAICKVFMELKNGLEATT